MTADPPPRAPAPARIPADRAEAAPPAEGGGAPARRVLFLVDTFWNPHGGTEGQLRLLVERLPARWAPEVWVVHRSPWLEEHGFPCPTRSLDIRSLRRLRWMPRIARLSRALRRERFDVVVALMADAGLLATALGPRAGTPVIVSRRDLGFWQTPASLRLLRRAARGATAFLANAEAVRRHVVEAEQVPPGAVEVVRNGHDPSVFAAAPDPGLRARLGIPADAVVVGMLANLKPLKRQADLVDAAARLARRFPSLHVLLVGDGDPAPLLARARDAGLDGRVHVLHAQHGVGPILAHLAVGVLCSESEGLSNAILECMACGLPVVASAVGGNPELVADGVTGVLHPVGDVPALAAALARLVGDPALARAMGRAGRARFETEFGVGRMVDETVAAFDRAAGAPPPPASDLAWETIEDLETLEAIAEPWRDLVGPRRFFGGPDWTIEWLRHAAEGATPYALVARDRDGRLAGVLPLARRRGALEVPGGADGADHVDVLALPGREHDVARGAVARLLASRWRRLRLRHLAEDGALRLALFREKRLPLVERFATVCPYVAAQGTFDGFLARLSAKHRGNLRRAVRAFRADPTCDVERLGAPEEVEAGVDRILALHAARFRERGEASAFSGPRVRAFHAALARRLAARGGVLLAFLRLGGRDAAGHYGFRSGGALLHFQSGFDPAHASRSPGTSLFLEVAETDVFARGLSEYDFLDGDEGYKRSVATGERRLFDVAAWRPTRAGRAAARVAAAAGLWKDAMRAGSDAAGSPR